MNKKCLISYFSCSGITKGVAEKIKEITGGDLFEITPTIPYTNADLNWNNKKSRSSVEMDDEKARPEISSTISNINEYDIVFIGFPVWWYVAPRIINTFIEKYDLTNKVVIPFCTSGGSGMKNCEDDLKRKYPNISWYEGKRLTSSDNIQNWINEILNKIEN